MKKYLIVIIGLSILVFTGCSKTETIDEMINEMPTLHDPIELDIDEDGVADFQIKYSQIIIEPLTLSSGTNGIADLLVPYGLNETLNRKEVGSLFLTDLEEIKEFVEEPLFWRNTFSRTIVSITTINAEEEWPNIWEVNSSIEYSTYFVGLKIVSDNESQLGWVEVEVDTNDGSISIVNKGIL